MNVRVIPYYCKVVISCRLYLVSVQQLFLCDRWIVKVLCQQYLGKQLVCSLNVNVCADGLVA